ncbi:MAG: cytidine deaminase [Lachnospiraceae bacterium]|nr:cytidine deaminase [Lachnospiraceae bacterium]
MSYSVEELINRAVKAREQAYMPYSGYAVGACVYTERGNYYSGCNIENASYGATNCAERTAIFKAVSEGERKIKAMAVVGGEQGRDITGYAYPCGVCRQVLREFGEPNDTIVYVGTDANNYRKFTLGELLPFSFNMDFKAM